MVDLFNKLGTIVELQVNNTCGVHVHVSLGPRYTPEQVRRVAKAVVWFEDAMFSLLPLSRRASKYCARLMPANMDPEEIFWAVDNCRHEVEVAEVIGEGERKLSVNFTNLYHGRTPGVEAPQGALG